MTLNKVKCYNIYMKNVIKRIFVYLGVAIISLIATCVLCAGFLFFYRDGNIFGFQYISKKEVIYAKVEQNLSATEKIEINGKNFDIVVQCSSTAKNLIGAMENKVFGYTTKKKGVANFTLNYISGEKKAVFTAQEPSGWLSKNKSYIVVVIPKDVASNKCLISISSNKGDITIDGKDLLKAGEMSIKSAKGDVQIKNSQLAGNVRFEVGSGSFSIDETCSSENKINITSSINSGKVFLNKIDSANLKIDKCEVEKLTKGEIYLLKANELYSASNINGGGKIIVKDVVSTKFTSRDTDISIENISGDVPSVLEVSGTGRVKVVNSKCELRVIAHNGKVVVDNPYKAINIASDGGDIVVNNATSYVSVSSGEGNIDVNFSENAGNYSSSDSEASRKIFATTMNGKITVKGLQNGEIKATNKGVINLVYNKVVGNNNISGKNGLVNIVVPAPGTPVGSDYAFNLNVVKTEVNCDIEVGSVKWLEPVAEGGKAFNNIYNENNIIHNNNLVVESLGGVIKIRSVDLI